ncbi:MAG: hypothetical protein IJ644_10585 [Oscillospiraceae bacterium]|nr:hypothetical protein [Oscillospiraceae bacterium]
MINYPQNHDYDAFNQWFEENFFLSSDRLERLGCSYGNFWQIVRSGMSSPQEREASWSRWNFHFEVLWPDADQLFDVNQIYVEAHLEMLNPEEMSPRQKEIRRIFEHNDLIPHGKNGVIYSEIVPADFSSENRALETIWRIIKVLQEDSGFQRCAKLADIIG